MQEENQRQRAVHIAEGEGKMLRVADELVTFKVSSEDTGGAGTAPTSRACSGGPWRTPPRFKSATPSVESGAASVD
jgi:hypothetical protein